MKKYRFLGSSLALLTGLLSVSTVYSVPAKPGIVSLKQADGETIQARIIGDEYFQTYLTADGFPLIFSEGNYEYARVCDNKLVSTGVKASDPAYRSVDDKNMLLSISTDMVSQYHNAAYRKARLTRNGVNPRKTVVTSDRSRYMISNFPNTGRQKGLVLLVEYQDVKFTLSDPHDYFSRLLNEPGFSDLGATGSARDYFIESSHGKFEPEFDVFGPVTLPEKQAYYGSNTGGYNDAFAWKMVTTAAEYLDSTVDFSEYDRDNDGYIDNIYVFYAGEGESGGGGYETVWPHAAQIAIIDKKNQYIHDGKIIDHYACSNEMDFEKPDGVGTFCHEFSHVMGLPDFYATGYQNCFTPGPFSLLDSGSYNNNSRTPPLYSAFERYCAGWLDLEIIENKDNITLPPIGANKAYAIMTENPDEFYILENRQKTSWDSHMPGHGMLVWHVDYDADAWKTNSVNNDPQHQHLDIVEADDHKDYDTCDGDPFPGTKNVTAFTDDTTPSMKSWDGKRLSMPITDIKETEDGFITFKIAGGYEEVAVPGKPEIVSAGSKTATIQWEPAEGATDYFVTVYTPGNYFIVPGYDKTSTKGASEITLTNLTPETDYCIYVQSASSRRSGFPSAVTEFRTLAGGFADYKVISTPASEISDTSFIAHWESLDDAVEYSLSVFECEEGDPEKTSVDFTGGISDLPEGWTATSKAVYNMAAYSGKAVPSLRLTTTGDYLETAEFPDAISSVSFWHRGNGSATAGNSIMIEGKSGESWKEIAAIPVKTDQGGSAETITAIPEGTTAIRLSYKGEAKGSLAVDDIEIFHGHSIKKRVLESYDAIPTGNTSTFKVEHLTPLTDYCFIVTATDSEGISSLPSDPMYLSTLEASDVSELILSPADAEYVEIIDPAGLIVAKGNKADALRNLMPGIYMVKANGKTIKRVIK